MLNRINQSLTEKKEYVCSELSCEEQKCEELWNKSQFNDSEFWFLKSGSYIISTIELEIVIYCG